MLIDARLETSILIKGKTENITFLLKFIEDKNSKERFGVDWSSISADTMLISLKNWHHSDPITLNGLQNVGHIDNKELHIIFSALSIGTGSMMQIMFSAYTGRDISND
jgi:hypothetical protein